MSKLEELRKREEQRHRDFLNRILTSQFAKEWIKNREINIKEEVEFYGRELTEQEWKSNLLYEFFEQDLKDICLVLPEIWREIREEVKEELEYTVLESPEKFEEQAGYSSFGYGYVKVDFNLAKHLEYIEEQLQKILKQQHEESK